MTDSRARTEDQTGPNIWRAAVKDKAERQSGDGAELFPPVESPMARRRARHRSGSKRWGDGPRRPGMPVGRVDWRSQGCHGQDGLTMRLSGRVTPGTKVDLAVQETIRTFERAGCRTGDQTPWFKHDPILRPMETTHSATNDSANRWQRLSGVARLATRPAGHRRARRPMIDRDPCHQILSFVPYSRILPR